MSQITSNVFRNKVAQAVVENLTILYRPVRPKELALIAASGYREFLPRLPEQPIFYPVLNEEYARQIAREWNVPDSGTDYLTRFNADKYEKLRKQGMHFEL